MSLAITMLKAYAAAHVPALRDEEGQGMVEYTMIIGAISIVIVGLFMATNLGTAITAQVTALAGLIDPAP